MNERHMLQNNRQIDFEIGQPDQSHPHPEPCVFLGGTTNFLLSNSDFEPRNLLDYHDGAAYYGMNQYPQPHPPTNLELGVPGIIPAGSSFYNMHLNPASGCSRTFPVHVNNVSTTDQLPSSSNYRGNAIIPMDEYARSNFSMDGVISHGLCKRKNAEAIPGNNVQYYYNVSAGPSSSISSVSSPPPPPPLDSGVSLMDVSSFTLPEYNRAVAAGLHRDSVRTHSYNHLVPGSFMGQPFQPSRATWMMDQQTISNSTGGGGGALPWNVTPILPCFPGSSNIHGASLEIANVGPQGYHEAATGHRGPGNFLHSAAPMINHQPHNLHPAPCIQGIRGLFPVSYQPPVTAATPGGGGHLLNNNAIQQQHTSLSNSSIDVEALPPTSAFRNMYHPHRRGGGVLPDRVSRHRNVPYLNILPADEVAILEIPGGYEVGNSIDHHSDMRLDIDDMSYEELLALSEQIGNVNTGLSERTIAGHLKTRLYRFFSASINLEELPSTDQKVDSCIICQDEYEEKDKIGSLDCGHEYHEECLKKWLNLKNVCPICKSTALVVQQQQQQQHKDG
ncbi:hypothetical protein Dimus_012698 [Dionaea muscipula]